MKESDPDQYEETEEMMILLTELATQFLANSPEFRRQFARIHAKFLEYPESREVIAKSLSAYKRHGGQISTGPPQFETNKQ
jgi:hypothetical protein